MTKPLRYFGYRSFEPEYDTMKEMRKRGIDTMTIMVSNNTNFMGEPYTRYQPTWIWKREYDFTLFDKNMTDVINAVPDVKLNVVLDLNPPKWWMPMLAGRDVYAEFGRVAPNKQYREDVCDYLKSLLEHAVKNYPGRFLNFFVMGGRTTEWFDGSMGAESMARIEAWDKWREERGLAKCDIPGFSVRYSGVPESSGLLRTPATHQVALEYLKFNSEVSLETVALFCKTARAALPEGIGVGITYGYTFELTTMCYSKASFGQLEFERLYDMPEIDMSLSPVSYGPEQRGMGGTNMAIIPLETVKSRGKLPGLSIDTTTFTSRFPKAPGKSGGVSICGRPVEWKTPEEVRAGLRRDMCYTLINGLAVWNFDMWGGWFSNDAALETLEQNKRIWDAEANVPAGDDNEIIVTIDPQNCYYINDSHPDNDKFVRQVRRSVALSGSMYTTATVNDLEKMDLSRTKLIILCQPFDLDNGKLEKIRRLAKGKTLLWIYGPGIIHNGKWDPENMRRVAGAEFGSKEIVYNGNEIFMPEPEKATPEIMRQIAAYAKVHCWCKDNYPVFANERLAAIHVPAAVKTELILPGKYTKVRELFSGQEYSQVDRINVETAGPDTKLFRLEK